VEYKRDEHRVHLVTYHLIWVPKRKSILIQQVAIDCRQFIQSKCTEKGWEALELEVQPDHVYLHIRVWPTDSAAEVIKACKSATSKGLREKYADLLGRVPSLWTRSYFVSTADISKDAVQRYVTTEAF
jgi:putative transposase